MKICTFITVAGYWIIQRICFYSKCLFICKRGDQKCNIIYKPDAIGDFLLATGAIRALLSQKERWVLFCSPEVKLLAEYCFPEIEVEVVTGSNQYSSQAFWKKLKPVRIFCQHNRITKLICLKHSLSGMDHIILHWLDAEESAGTVNSPIQSSTPSTFSEYTFSHRVLYPGERKKFILEIEAHHSVCKAMFPNRVLKENSFTPFLPDSGNLPENTSKSLIIFPVTRSPLRNYPREKLTQCVKDFSERNPEFRILLSGAPSEITEVKAFQSLLSPEVTSEIRIHESVICAIKEIQCASIILTMESAPAHISTILNKPTVIILGGGHFDHFAPWGDSKRQIWLKNEIPCYHCNWNCIFPEALCITNISQISVQNALNEMATLCF